MTHDPDTDKISADLILPQWEPWDAIRKRVSDGDVILAAVGVCRFSEAPEKGWYYEYSVITVACDEHYFELECNGDPWGWDRDDIDFAVIIRNPKP